MAKRRRRLKVPKDEDDSDSDFSPVMLRQKKKNKSATEERKTPTSDEEGDDANKDLASHLKPARKSPRREVEKREFGKNFLQPKEREILQDWGELSDHEEDLLTTRRRSGMIGMERRESRASVQDKVAGQSMSFDNKRPEKPEKKTETAVIAKVSASSQLQAPSFRIKLSLPSDESDEDSGNEKEPGYTTDKGAGEIKKVKANSPSLDLTESLTERRKRGEWNCSACTYTYRSGSECQMCSTKKSKFELGQQALFASPVEEKEENGWNCDTCTFENPDRHKKCGMCGKSKKAQCFTIKGKEGMADSKESMEDRKEKSIPGFVVKVTDQKENSAGGKSENKSCIHFLDSDVEETEEKKSEGFNGLKDNHYENEAGTTSLHGLEEHEFGSIDSESDESIEILSSDEEDEEGTDADHDDLIDKEEEDDDVEDDDHDNGDDDWGWGEAGNGQVEEIGVVDLEVEDLTLDEDGEGDNNDPDYETLPHFRSITNLRNSNRLGIDFRALLAPSRHVDRDQAYEERNRKRKDQEGNAGKKRWGEQRKKSLERRRKKTSLKMKGEKQRTLPGTTSAWMLPSTSGPSRTTAARSQPARGYVNYYDAQEDGGDINLMDEEYGEETYEYAGKMSYRG